MSNETGFHIESNYEYVFNEIEGKMLDLQMVLHRPGDFITLDLIHIAEEMVDTAKYFARAQGLYDTGKLHDSIQYDRSAISQGKIVLTDPVQNPQGHYYAGHHEFGYHTRQGQFKEARPFLRPAMRAVQQASVGRVTSAALEVANFSGGMRPPIFNKNGVMGNNQGRIRAFYRQEGYTRQGLEKKLGNHISSNFGKSYTINRRDSSPRGINIYTSEGQRRQEEWHSPYTNANTYKMQKINPNWR